MAMKVNKTAIHRLSVDVSCGCRMYSEFEDAQCKNPLGAAPDEENPQAEKVFKPCAKHEADASLSMLEFLVSERLDEAISDAHTALVAPAFSQHRYLPPGIEEGDTGGVTAASSSIVQSVMKVAKPVAVRPRTADPSAIKTIQRSSEQLAKAGAAPAHGRGGAVEIAIEEGVEEDERYTPHIEEALDFLDDRERGLLEDE